VNILIGLAADVGLFSAAGSIYQSERFK